VALIISKPPANALTKKQLLLPLFCKDRLTPYLMNLEYNKKQPFFNIQSLVSFLQNGRCISIKTPTWYLRKWQVCVKFWFYKRTSLLWHNTLQAFSYLNFWHIYKRVGLHYQIGYFKRCSNLQKELQVKFIFGSHMWWWDARMNLCNWDIWTSQWRKNQARYICP
jgi:hypothetical protein